ncbi:hypothetical protein CYMTET_18726 [Cymbomonas tetramitiformis]|uniref:Right handed beta helix domain-containing protein n=1 Tax=Cymbomonas tetramitiformis TaxID=36881 RepID=A0AAE0L5L7_9CHLO|nr:hypothetical protein CYMTET_18726 [Cymbomonas tetramitiformis]
MRLGNWSRDAQMGLLGVLSTFAILVLGQSDDEYVYVISTLGDPETNLHSALQDTSLTQILLQRDISLSQETPSVTHAVTITGDCPALYCTLDGGNEFRIFTSSGFDAILQLKNLELYNGWAAESGGAVYVHDFGRLTLEDCLIHGNYAEESAGAVFANFASVELLRSKLELNTAVTNGGGLAAVRGLVLIQDSVVHGNHASSKGGGVYGDYGSKIVVNNSVVSSNIAQDGGALAVQLNCPVFNVNGGLTLENTSLSVDGSAVQSNQASGSGGAALVKWGALLSVTDSQLLANVAAAYGGALYADEEARLSLASSRCERSEAAEGGAVYSASAAVAEVRSATLVNNSALAGNGGAVLLHSRASAVIADSSLLEENRAAQGGGGVAADKGTALWAYDVELRRNRALVGAGVYLAGHRGDYRRERGHGKGGPRTDVSPPECNLCTCPGADLGVATSTYSLELRFTPERAPSNASNATNATNATAAEPLSSTDEVLRIQTQGVIYPMLSYVALDWYGAVVPALAEQVTVACFLATQFSGLEYLESREGHGLDVVYAGGAEFMQLKLAGTPEHYYTIRFEPYMETDQGSTLPEPWEALEVEVFIEPCAADDYFNEKTQVCERAAAFVIHVYANGTDTADPFFTFDVEPSLPEDVGYIPGPNPLLPLPYNTSFTFINHAHVRYGFLIETQGAGSVDEYLDGWSAVTNGVLGGGGGSVELRSIAAGACPGP